MLPTHQRFQFASPHQLSSSSNSFLFNVTNSWRIITLILGVQILATFLANLHGNIVPHEATNTELLYDWSIPLLLTLFLTFETHFLGCLLLIYNAILMTALLEWPRMWDFKTTPKEVFVHVLSISGVVGMRILLGYLFGRGTGFAYPLLFFNDAIHETTCGLSVILLYCITRRFYEGPGSQPSQLSPQIFLLLWSPNALRGPIFFWSFSVASVTGTQALLSLLLEKRDFIFRSSRTHSATAPSRWSRCLSMVNIFLMLAAVFMAISYIHSMAYQYTHEAHSEKVITLPEPVLAQFLLLSYPRRNDSTLLSSTLQSYSRGLGPRFTTSVYTTVEPASHPAFGDAQNNFRTAPSLTFFPDPDPATFSLSRMTIPGYLPGKQTFDLYSALSWAEGNVRDNKTRYIGIMEDDFEWCDDGWNELKAILYEVALRESSEPSKDKFCGIFVATGGSGLLVRPSSISLLRNALQHYAFELNPDIILQDCLRGALPECAGCRLAASRRLLFRHTGASKSTYSGRLYPEDRWQCGWRQPFNGKLGVWVP